MMPQKRLHKIKSDYGVNDYFDYYKLKGGRLNKKQYKKALYELHEAILQLLIDTEYTYKFPRRMGTFTIVKVAPKLSVIDGEIVTNYSINFKATMELRRSDPEAEKNKVKIYYENRHSNGYKYNYKYSTRHANFKNKNIYLLRNSRRSKHLLRDTIFEKGELLKSLNTNSLLWKKNTTRDLSH